MTYKIKTALKRETKLKIDALRRQLVAARKWSGEPAFKELDR